MFSSRIWRNPISIHAPPRGATGGTGCVKLKLLIFQFTPLREGRLETDSIVAQWFISIHAPPRGATFFVCITPSDVDISIHAPPRGATISARTTTRTNTFQFTPLREGRHIGSGCRGAGKISIHAPPRGATLQIFIISRSSFLFQFTPLREGRP